MSNPLGTVAELVYDGRDEALAAVSALSENFISVNGVLHIACAQPAIRVFESGKMRRRPHFEENISIDTRARCLDGHAAYKSAMIAYPLDSWGEVHRRLSAFAKELEVPPPESHLEAPAIHIPESIDPDIDARRQLDTLLKKELFSSGALSSPDSNAEAKASFESTSKHRRDLLEALLYAPGIAMPEDRKRALLASAEEIEDAMSVDLVIPLQGKGFPI